MRMLQFIMTTLFVMAVGCQGGEVREGNAASDPGGDLGVPVLGPADGLELPGEDLDRVKVGDLAPDFTLETFRGGTLTLSEFRGKKDVILVFYRGSW